MTEEIPSGEETATAEVSEPRWKCTMQLVLTVALRLRYLSNPTLTDRFIAESVSLTTGSPEKIAINTEFIREISLIWLCPFCFLEQVKRTTSFYSILLMNDIILLHFYWIIIWVFFLTVFCNRILSRRSSAFLADWYLWQSNGLIVIYTQIFLLNLQIYVIYLSRNFTYFGRVFMEKFISIKRLFWCSWK